VVRVSAAALNTMIDTCSLLAPLCAIKSVRRLPAADMDMDMDILSTELCTVQLTTGTNAITDGRRNLSDTLDMKGLFLRLAYLRGLVTSKGILTLRP